MSERDRTEPSTAILFGLVLSALASIALTVVYVLGGQPQVEGVLLLVALGGIGLSLILFAHRFLPIGRAIEERQPLASTPVDREWTALTFEGGAERIARRRAIARLLVLAVGALGVAAVFPIRSFGRAPGGSLFSTAWRRGIRAVTEAGRPIRAADVVPGTFVTVFPEGAVGSADSQAVLIGVDPALVSGAMAGAPTGGALCYSKICTHAGCPVGLYSPRSHELFCPCHQSVFAVLDGARPVGGPAARALPRLPLAVDGEGYLIATADFSEPVGPGFWDLP